MTLINVSISLSETKKFVYFQKNTMNVTNFQGLCLYCNLWENLKSLLARIARFIRITMTQPMRIQDIIHGRGGLTADFCSSSQLKNEHEGPTSKNIKI